MFAGPRDTGKGHFAAAVARLLLCANPGKGKPCGECRACGLCASGNHGDLRLLQPEEKSRVIKIDQVRQVIEFAALTPAFGDRKVVVINPADRLNRNAANSLLKCLEEPAAGTHLLLVCHRLHGVPPTIRSRCQVLRFPVPDRAESLHWLSRETGDEALAEMLLGTVEGSPLLARQLYLEDGGSSFSELTQGLDALRGGQLSAAEAAAVMAELPLEEALLRLRAYLQRWLRTMSANELADACRSRGLRTAGRGATGTGGRARGCQSAATTAAGTLLGRVPVGTG